MSIDLSTIRSGGKVSVTLTDGTKIIGGAVTERGRSLFIASDSFRVCDVPEPRVLRHGIASIDAYTPPTPEWDRPEVFAVKDSVGDVWYRRATGSWWIYTNPKAALSTERLDDEFGPCAVLAVYADGVER